MAVFGEVFDTEAARRRFAEYLTELIVAENKTVSGINREFVLTTDQSCLGSVSKVYIVIFILKFQRHIG